MLQIHKASAGSGKTYKLAFEYIKALLGVKSKSTDAYYLCMPKYLKGQPEINNRHRHILAITFTNKATEEMKRRIVDELDALSVIPADPSHDANYAKDLCDLFGCTRHELAEVAAKSLRQLLHDYDDFNVTTIDSFFQRVLRTFARELDRQGDFNVELNDLMAVQSAVGTMIDDFNTDPDAHPLLGKWIYEYISEQIDEGKKSNFFNRKSYLHTNLVSLVAKICEEQFKPFATEMQVTLSDPKKMPMLKQEIEALCKNILDKVSDESHRVWAALGERGITLDKINGKLSLPRTFRDYFLQGKPVDVNAVIFSSTYDKLLTYQTVLFPKKAKAEPGDTDAVIELLKYIRRHYANYQVLKDISKSLDQLILLGYCWRYLNEFVTQNNIVLLSDTNHLLSRIIGADDTPFIYERMAVQFRHFLIDEFQDTSKMQWNNLKPLVASGLDEQYDSLIIGDEKQSIYRFRNSDSSLLHSQVQDVDFPANRYDLKIAGNGEGENTNYRSSADVVRFNNTLFSHLAARLNIRGFENVVQDVARRNQEVDGYVRFIPFIKPKKTSKKDKQQEAEQLPALETEKPAEKDNLDVMIENIISQHDEGNYAWSDIVILVATNLEGAKAIERIISKYPQIPVISDEALYVRKSPAVQRVVGILEILANEDFNAKSSKKYRYSSGAEVEAAISRFNYYFGSGMEADKAMDYAVNTQKADHELPSKLHNIIDTIRSRKPSSLVAMVETIINEMVPDDERKSQISFLTAFQDYVIDYSSHYHPSIKALLSHWNSVKHKLSVSSAANVDAVKVMTIHKSKGLEFDCVHIPYGSWEEAGKPREQWIEFPTIERLTKDYCPPALLVDFNSHTKCHAVEGTYFNKAYVLDEIERHIDTMNLTYVAYTRASRELMVYYDPEEGIGIPIAQTFADTTLLPQSPNCVLLSDYYNPVDFSFTLGAPTHKKVKKDEESHSKPLPLNRYNIYYHEKAEVLTKVEDLLGNDITDTDTTDSASDTYEIDEEARTRGITLHETLSQIGHINDIDDAIAVTCRKQRLSADEAKDIRAYIDEMLNVDDARIRRWFVNNDGALNEQSIYLPEGVTNRNGVNDNKRPDRIVYNTDGTVDIIDYKFTTQTRKSHHHQVQSYVALLNKMGYDEVRGYLWYPFLQKIIEV